MGNNAEASIVFGFGIDLHEHEEIALRVLGPESKYESETDFYDWPEILVNHLKEKNVLSDKIQVHRVGYYDEPDYFIGVQLAWACDYTADELDVEKLVVTDDDKKELTLLGQSFGREPKMWLCPYGG